MIETMQTTSLKIVQQCIFFATEKLTKACLHLDPGTKERLKALAGKSISVHIKDSMPMYRDGITVYVFPTATGIELSAEHIASADASISLSGKDLVNLLRKSSAPNTMAIDGDHEVLLAVLDIVKGFDIDWEQAISPLTGDVLAHHIGKQARATEQWLSQSLKEAKRLAEEYMDEELPIAKQSAPLKPFFDGLEKAKAAGNAFRDSLQDKWIKK